MEKVVKSPKKLKKHIAMIHSSSKLNLIQRKISNVLLECARSNMQTAEIHTITIARLCELVDYQGYNYDWIKNALHCLLETKIEWDIFNELGNEEGWAASTMLSSVLVTKGRGAKCCYSYSPLLRGYLQDPSRYAEIDLETQAKFTSLYGLALYENCVRYKKLPQTKQWELSRFREIMGILDDSSYPTFWDFKKRVLDKAVEEVNKFSEVYIEPQLTKQGKKTVAIKFKITPQRKATNLVVSPRKNIDSLVTSSDGTEKKYVLEKMVNEFGINNKKAENYLKDYGVDRIKKSMDYVVNTWAYRSGNILGLGAGYLVEVIREGYDDTKNLKEIVTDRNKKIDEMRAQEKKLEVELQKNKPKYIQYLQGKLRDILTSLSEEELSNLKNEFKKFLKDSSLPMSIEYHLEHYGFFDPFVVEFFAPFLVRKKEFSSKFVSLEKYVEHNQDAVEG
jgi:plasmid replication initiation protein